MFIGIDIGHTKVKAVAFDSDWRVAGEHSVKAGLVHPRDDRTEIPMEDRWGIVLDSLNELQNQVGPDDGIQGIGLAGGGGGLYPLDENKQPFMNGIPLWDERARNILEEWQAEGTYQEICNITGTPIPPGAALIVLRWLKDNQPDRYEKIQHILNLKDMVRFKLTGELALEISDATFSFTNHRTQDYDDELLELAGIAEKQDSLPDLKDRSYEIAGYTTKEVEQKTGISEGIPVVAGAHDACANSIGVGALSEDIVTTAGGTSSLSTIVTDSPSVRLDRWCCENFVQRGTWMLEIATPTGTIVLDWFVDDFCDREKRRASREGRDLWDVIEEEIQDVETNVLFHPFLFRNVYGYLYPTTASGCFSGLSPTDGRREMLRAVYESIAFMHRWQIDLFDETFGVNEIRFTGGAARSDFWAQMFADVLDMNVTKTTTEESGCFGAALLAAIGVGELSGLPETSDFVEIEEVYRPADRDYERKYQAFVELTDRLEVSWDSHHTLLRGDQ